MNARQFLSSIGVAACLAASAAMALAGAGDKYRRQTLVNDGDSNANDLHIEFTSGVGEAKLRPKAQPPGHDGDGAIDSESGGRVVDWPPPDSFGVVPSGGVAYLDYGYNGHKPVADPDKSYWTYDGNALPGFRMQGVSMALRWSSYEEATVNFRNDTDVPQQVQNIQLWKNNDVANQTIDQYFLATGDQVLAAPTDLLLRPGEELSIPFGAVLKGTYLLATADSRNADDPDEMPEPTFAAGPSEADAHLMYDVLTGSLVMDTWGNALNGFIISAPSCPFTGLVELPPGFLFTTNRPDMIAAQFIDPAGGATIEGLHDFGMAAVDRAALWDPVEGRWNLDDWSFSYTIDGLPGERVGEIDVTALLPGDTDRDGDVDAWDIQKILAANSYDNGPGFSWEHGDFDGDTLVTWADIDMILDHDQYDAGVEGLLMAMVPEPTALCMLALGAAGAVWRRRRRA